VIPRSVAGGLFAFPLFGHVSGVPLFRLFQAFRCAFRVFGFSCVRAWAASSARSGFGASSTVWTSTSAWRVLGCLLIARTPGRSGRSPPGRAARLLPKRAAATTTAHCARPGWSVLPAQVLEFLKGSLRA